LLAEHGRDLIYRYRLRPAPGYELMSPAVVDLTGYTPEEFYADPELGLKLMDPEDRPLLERLMRDGPGAVDQPLLLRARRRDGSVIWLEQRDIPIHDEDGNLVALEGIARDGCLRSSSRRSSGPPTPTYGSRRPPVPDWSPWSSGRTRSWG
jgi:PAS domain S-box-containing protein